MSRVAFSVGCLEGRIVKLAARCRRRTHRSSHNPLENRALVSGVSWAGMDGGKRSGNWTVTHTYDVQDDTTVIRVFWHGGLWGVSVDLCGLFLSLVTVGACVAIVC